MIADGQSAEDKATWVVRGGMFGSRTSSFAAPGLRKGNGAGIRFETGRSTIDACSFADNEMGILTANSSDLSLEVSDSEFGDAPRHAGSLHHLLYVGAIGKFVLRGSRFHNGYRGHLVKSRARESHVLYNSAGRWQEWQSFLRAGISQRRHSLRESQCHCSECGNGQSECCLLRRRGATLAGEWFISGA